MHPRITPGFWILALVLLAARANAQCTFTAADCSSNMANGTSVNFNTLTWTHNSGPACPTGGSTSYAGSLLTTMGNNTTLTISADFTVNGDYNITNSGSSSTLVIPAGVTLHVTGDLGDCTNNNVNFSVDGTLIVDGYISGKNNNAFSGSGSITATGGLYFQGQPTCSPCNIIWNVGSCVPAGAFCTLPISLISFEAEPESDGIHLKWSTESEQNVDFFNVQRSKDGRKFEDILRVPGHGTTTERHDYECVDISPLTGRSYYRLKETDLDGAITYYKILSVNFSDEHALVVYPQPVADGVLHVNAPRGISGPSRITLTDLLGNVVLDVVSSESSNRLALSCKPGIYVLRFSNPGFIGVRKVVIN